VLYFLFLHCSQLVHCFKGDLLVASEYFEGLIRSGNPCPVHIKHIKPHIFKLVMRQVKNIFSIILLLYITANCVFTCRFISVHCLEEISNLKDTILLGLAADEFLMEPLKNFCASEIERMVTVETVWQTLNSTCLAPKLAAACSKVINYKIIFLNVLNNNFFV